MLLFLEGLLFVRALHMLLYGPGRTVLLPQSTPPPTFSGVYLASTVVGTDQGLSDCLVPRDSSQGIHCKCH